MLEIPEYHSLKAIYGTGETVTVSVLIDGNDRMMPQAQMSPHVIARLVEAFFSGELDFMSFDEHPMRLTAVTLKRKDRTPTVTLSARSLEDADRFPKKWEIADSQIYGAPPWNGQMK